MSRPRILTLILAGGEGSRLDVLTERRAKPALAYAGSFRLIDFPLSNALHSQLSDVWVVEQYRPHSLNEQLANGRPWDLDRTQGGLRVLPPYEGGDRDGFAQGNADAIHRHRALIREFGADLILVLSADHIYRLDYRDVIDRHQDAGADLTMVTTEVPREDASRFGVVQVGSDDLVTDFDYKPDEPASERVTTEVFLFDAEKLLRVMDELDEDDALEDYGDALVPRFVEEGTVAHLPLDGYWRDVGTVDSYWEGHMDLLGEDPAFTLDAPGWPIRTRDLQRLPARIHSAARVQGSLVAPGADVQGTVADSVLSPGVHVEEGAVVRGAVLLRDVRVRAGAVVSKAVVDERAVIGAEAHVGAAEGAGEDAPITLVGMEAEVADGQRVEAGAQVDAAEEGR